MDVVEYLQRICNFPTISRRRQRIVREEQNLLVRQQDVNWVVLMVMVVVVGWIYGNPIDVVLLHKQQ